MGIGNIGPSGLCWGSQAHPNLLRSAVRVNRPWTQGNRIITHSSGSHAPSGRNKSHPMEDATVVNPYCESHERVGWGEERTPTWISETSVRPVYVGVRKLTPTYFAPLCA